jgi:hypothetical protein
MRLRIVFSFCNRSLTKEAAIRISLTDCRDLADVSSTYYKSTRRRKKWTLLFCFDTNSNRRRVWEDHSTSRHQTIIKAIRTRKAREIQRNDRKNHFFNITVQCEKQQERNHDFFTNEYSNQRIWYIDDSEILTQRLRFDVVQFVLNRFSSFVWNEKKRSSMLLYQHKIERQQLIDRFSFIRHVQTKVQFEWSVYRQHS